MKINYKLNLTIIFLIVFIASCTSKKHSLGMDDEVRVVCSKLDEPIIRKYLSSVFNDSQFNTRVPNPTFLVGETGEYLDFYSKTYA